MSERVAAVVVTYNRVADLRVCLDSLAAQSRPPDEVIVVDNASSDDTAAELAGRGVTVLRLAENLGGAGGFAAGLGAALEAGHDWLWLMDDDSVPEPAALAELLARAAADDGERVGAVVPAMVYDNGQVWAGVLRGARARGGGGSSPNEVGTDGRAQAPEVDTGAFVGPLIAAAAARAAGLPRADFFIWHDDVEYLLRLRHQGWRLLAAPAARMHHPAEPTVGRRILGREIRVMGVPPWKEYYDARNVLVVDRLFRGTDLARGRDGARRLRDEAARAAAVAAADPRGLQRVLMRIAGLVDGARGRMGRRVAPGATLPWRR